MAREPAPGRIVTRTPLRVSLAGGGTDLPAYYERDYGAVLSTAIDQYVYVTLKRHDTLFDAPIRLNYSETEQVRTVAEISNDIARACLEYLKISPPIYISTVADIPAASGLGSSSAFCVGLLHALHAYRGEPPSAGQLAAEAAHVEMSLLGRPIGKQDHYAAAYGGVNLFRFLAGGNVSVEPVPIDAAGVERLFSSFLLLWTGLGRDAGAEQRRNTPLRIDELGCLRSQAHELHRALSNGFTPPALGRALSEGWSLKRGLADTISNSKLDEWHRRGIEAGAFGGKVCGAGGGGFLLFVVPKERREAVCAALPELSEARVGYESQGSRLLMPNRE